MAFFRKESKEGEQGREEWRAAAREYSAKTIENLSRLPIVSSSETGLVEESFLGNGGLSQEEYWKHVEDAIEALRKTNPALADFIETVGSDIHSEDGRDVLVMLTGMIANSQPPDTQ
jgi:hypothetical protein